MGLPRRRNINEDKNRNQEFNIKSREWESSLLTRSHEKFEMQLPIVLPSEGGPCFLYQNATPLLQTSYEPGCNDSVLDHLPFEHLLEITEGQELL